VTFPKPTNIPNAVLNNVYGIGMLDVNMNLPFFTSTSRLTFGGASTLKPFLERVNIKSLGGLVNATNMFYFCHSLQSLNEHEWDTSKWTSIQHMFHTNRKLTYLDTRNWNLSAVTNMDGIFTNCDQLLEIAGIENWNVENVSQFSSLFSGCLRFRGSSSGILDLSNWNVTNKATTFYRMFQITRNLNKVIFGNWDTRNVTNASEMFSNSVITELDMSMLNLSAATTVADMFINARSNLRQLILPTLPLSATFNSTGFLRDACSLSSLTFSNSGINNSISFFNCAFSANSLNYIFQNLSNTGSGKTVNVALNPGLSGVGFNPTIATNKGWTVIS
jgi:surface protein